MALSPCVLSRYVIRSCLAPVTLCLALLCVVVFALQFLRLGHHLLSAETPPLALLKLFVYALPTLLTFALPLATMGGTLLALCRLGDDGQWRGLQTVGYGRQNLLNATLLVGLGAAGVTAFVATIEPPALQRLHALVVGQATRGMLARLRPLEMTVLGQAEIYAEKISREGSTTRLVQTFISLDRDALVSAKAVDVQPRAGRFELTFRAGEIQLAKHVRLSFGQLQLSIDPRQRVAAHFSFLARRARRGPSTSFSCSACLNLALLAWVAAVFGSRWRVVAALCGTAAYYATMAGLAAWWPGAGGPAAATVALASVATIAALAAVRRAPRGPATLGSPTQTDAFERHPETHAERQSLAAGSRPTTAARDYGRAGGESQGCAR